MAASLARTYLADRKCERPAFLLQPLYTPFSTSSIAFKLGDKRDHRAGVAAKEEGAEGERLPTTTSALSAYPTLETHERLFNGVKFKVLPVCYVTCSSNNTKVFVQDKSRGEDVRDYKVAIGSCVRLVLSEIRTVLLKNARTTKFYVPSLITQGTEGFKNCKKGTSVAGQTVAFNTAKRALDNGVSTVRLVMSGFGPGRSAAVRGLQMAGLKIVSISDWTPSPLGFSGVWTTPQRPRKPKRL